MRNTLLGVVLASFLACTNAFAQQYGPPPTLAETHEFLAGIFQRYRIEYAVWHGPGTRDYNRGRAGFYGGRDCYSEVGAEQSGRAFAVDWSVISAVNNSDTTVLYVSGQLVRASQDPGAWHYNYANFHLYFPDAKLTRSVANAFALLRGSCERRSRFD